MSNPYAHRRRYRRERARLRQAERDRCLEVGAEAHDPPATVGTAHRREAARLFWRPRA